MARMKRKRTKKKEKRMLRVQREKKQVMQRRQKPKNFSICFWIVCSLSIFSVIPLNCVCSIQA